MRVAIHLQDMLQGLAILSRCHSFHSPASTGKKISHGNPRIPSGLVALSRNTQASSDKLVQMSGWHSTAHNPIWCAATACKCWWGHQQHRYWGIWKWEPSKLKKALGFYSAVKPVSPHCWSRSNKQCWLPTMVSGKGKRSCHKRILRLLWIQTSDQISVEGKLGWQRCNSVFHHKPSRTPSLTFRTGDGNTSSASSLAKTPTLWFKPQSLHFKSGHIQVLSTISFYIRLPLHHHLQEKNYRFLWLAHLQLEEPLSISMVGLLASTENTTAHTLQINRNHEVIRQWIREAEGECSLTAWGIRESRGKGVEENRTNQPLGPTTLRSEDNELRAREGTDFPGWTESWCPPSKGSRWTRQEMETWKSLQGQKNNRVIHQTGLPQSRANFKKGKLTPLSTCRTGDL